MTGQGLTRQTSTLVRQEIQLAQAELAQQGKVAGKGVGMLARRRRCRPAGARRAERALIALLDKAMATWVAALIVMALWAVVAAVVAKAGQKSLQTRRRRHPRPSKP